MEQDVLLVPCDEEGGAKREPVEPLEIDISAVHDIEGSGLGFDPV